MLNVRVPSDLKEALKKAAEADERSVSTMTVRILREWLQQQGFLEPVDGMVARKGKK